MKEKLEAAVMLSIVAGVVSVLIFGMVSCNRNWQYSDDRILEVERVRWSAIERSVEKVAEAIVK